MRGAPGGGLPRGGRGGGGGFGEGDGVVDEMKRTKDKGVPNGAGGCGLDEFEHAVPGPGVSCGAVIRRRTSCRYSILTST